MFWHTSSQNSPFGPRFLKKTVPYVTIVTDIDNVDILT